MISSILNSTKQVLGLDHTYTPFDHDITTFINAAFSVLDQLGIGPTGGFFITGSDEKWDDFQVPDNQMNMVQTYIYLKVRNLFDPPQTSFHIAAMDKQIAEYEGRLSIMRENALRLELAVTEEVV